MSSTPSSDRDGSRRPIALRLVVMLGNLVLALMALGLLVVVFGSSYSAQAKVLSGAAILAVGVLGAAGVVAHRGHERPVAPQLTTLDGATATFVAMRPHWLAWTQLLTVLVVLFLVLVAVFEPRAAVGLALLLALPLVSMLPALRTARRARSGLLMSRERVEIRTWDRITSFAWDDILAMRVENTTWHGVVLNFVVDESATTFKTRSLRILWRLGPTPHDGRYGLPLLALGGEADLVPEFVQQRWQSPSSRDRLAEPW